MKEHKRHKILCIKYIYHLDLHALYCNVLKGAISTSVKHIVFNTQFIIFEISGWQHHMTCIPSLTRYQCKFTIIFLCSNGLEALSLFSSYLRNQLLLGAVLKADN